MRLSFNGGKKFLAQCQERTCVDLHMQVEMWGRSEAGGHPFRHEALRPGEWLELRGGCLLGLEGGPLDILARDQAGATGADNIGQINAELTRHTLGGRRRPRSRG